MSDKTILIIAQNIFGVKTVSVGEIEFALRRAFEDAVIVERGSRALTVEFEGETQESVQAGMDRLLGGPGNVRVDIYEGLKTDI